MNDMSRADSAAQMWHRAFEVANTVHTLTASFPRHELFGLTAQIRRAAVMLASHVSEGSAGKSTVELVRHIQAARTAYSELNTQLLLAERLGYLDAQLSLQTQLADLGLAIESSAVLLRNRERRIAVQRSALAGVR